MSENVKGTEDKTDTEEKKATNKHKLNETNRNNFVAAC